MSKKAKIVLSSTIAGAGLIGLYTWLLGAQTVKLLFVYWRTFSFFGTLTVVGVALCIYLAVRASRKAESVRKAKYSIRQLQYDYDYEYGRKGKNKPAPKAPEPEKATGLSPAKLVALSVVVGAATIYGIIFFAIGVGYETDKNYVTSAEITESSEGSAPDFEDRAPYDVAVAGSTANMGSTAGTAQETKSIADSGDTGLWNTLIVRQGFGVGYESAQTVTTPLYGTVDNDDVEFCKFDADKAPLRFGGALVQNNLSRVLDWTLPLDVTYDSNDAYSYCDGDTPYVVIPLKQVHGWYAAYETPYGVITMNGKTGEFRTITDTDEIAEIPGSTYPMSLAYTQREALKASGSLNDYLFGTVGYTLSTYGGNGSEFQLVDSDTKKVDYVTPISPRGESEAVVGLTVVNAKSFKPGVLNTIEVYLLDPDKPSKANSTKVQDLMNEYRNLLAFANGDVGIYEIIPGKDGSWVASIGSGQGTIYRAIFAADGIITLYNANGDEVSKTAINGEPDAEPSENGGGEEVPTDSNGNIDLSTLTPDQLRELGKDIIDELAKRAE